MSIYEKLASLGLNQKEIQVYMYLVEYGISAASEVARHIAIPKSTVNFLADSLWKKGLLHKSYRTKTGYYEADISLLETCILQEIALRKSFLTEVVPKLKDINKNTISKPKITFLDGMENCRNAYLELLKVKDIFYEFGAHHDLVEAFGQEFMDEFIRERVRKNIFCDSLGTYEPVESELQKKDSKEMRNLQIFDGMFGKVTSSIAIYGDRVLILNLHKTYTGVLIENPEFAETMKTIFRICKR